MNKISKNCQTNSLLTTFSENTQTKKSKISSYKNSDLKNLENDSQDSPSTKEFSLRKLFNDFNPYLNLSSSNSSQINRVFKENLERKIQVLKKRF